MLKAVIFDLGGVVFEDGTKKLVSKLAQKTGKPTRFFEEIFLGPKSYEYRANKISGNEYFEWVAEKIGNGFSPDEINLMWVSEYVEIPGMRDLIKDLKKKGLKVSVLSDNVPERINYLEDKYGFKGLFDDMVLSFEVNMTKPSDEIFRLAIKRLDVLASESIFVDDKVDNVNAAIGLGLKGILFQNAEQLRNDLLKI